MGEARRSMEGNFHMKRFRRFWGLRPWKRHSTILMVVGMLYALIGFQYMIAPPSNLRETSLVVIMKIAPVKVWGAIFLISGLLTSLSSRWPPFAERWGYMILAGLSAMWAAAYLMGFLFFHSPISNLNQVIIWGCLSFMWWAISGLLNPDKTAVTQHGQN